ncbi:unnamed protein product, partial [Heterotrigona itama]
NNNLSFRMARRVRMKKKRRRFWPVRYIDVHNSASFHMRKNEEDSGQSNNIDVYDSTSFNMPW